ncbi:MAG: ATP synthase F1 subunit gamma [Planctomycetota bacterium]
MKGVKELKARLKSIGNIRKITSTMELVATAKLRRLQERAVASRPYADAIRQMISQVAAVAPEKASPLLAVPDEVERECVVVIAADRGLCGAFNANIFRKAHGYIREREAEGVKVEVYTFGRRAARFFDRVRAEVLGNCEDPVEKIGYRRVAGIMASLIDDYLEGRLQKVTVIYTRFESVVTFKPTIEGLLPFEADPEEAGDAEVARTQAESDYIMEPSAEDILSKLLPKSLEMRLFAGILESLASEFAARRMAMKNATDAADDMSEELTMEYNKARQAGITGDLLDIVAGAEAQAG